jgi:hypothetical protein
MDQYEDITHEVDALMVRDETIAATYDPMGFFHTLPPEVAQYGQMFRLGGALVVLAGACLWFLFR